MLGTWGQNCPRVTTSASAPLGIAAAGQAACPLLVPAALLHLPGILAPLHSYPALVMPTHR